MDFIKGLYEEGLVEGQLDEAAIQRIKRRVEARELAYYSFIVGKENVMKAKRFIELASNGQGAPSSIVDGYLPAIEMLDDIVNAGPSYINMLLSLHKRAKRSRK